MKLLTVFAAVGMTAVSAARAQPVTGPLVNIANEVESVGVYPNLTYVQVASAVPSAGLHPGKSIFVTIFNMGADLELEKMIGLPGASVHFQEFIVPENSNLSWGSEVGDVIVGNPGPFIPWVAHLQKFTFEQKMFHNHIFLEGGKANAGDYFALATCDLQFGCISSTTIVQNSAGFAPPPYANWSARLGINVTHHWLIQGGFWKYNPMYPFSNGWETSNHGVKEGNVLIADLSYVTDPRKDLYASSCEVMYYHNDLAINPATGGSSGNNHGVFVGAKKTFWRAAASPTATSLTASFGGVTELNPHAAMGVRSSLDVGLSVSGLFKARPFDTYGLRFTWARLTDEYQDRLKLAYVSSSGKSYMVGPDEFGFTADATFVLTPQLIFQPYVSYIKNANSWFAPGSPRMPQDGINIGGTFVIQLSQLLGFAPYHLAGK